MWRACCGNTRRIENCCYNNWYIHTPYGRPAGRSHFWQQHMSKDSIKKSIDDYEMRDEYDFSEMTVMPRGRYAPDKRATKNAVVLAPDVAEAFPDDDSVNEALRLVLRMAKIPHIDPVA